MARTPKLVNIRLQALLMLLNYRWAAASSKDVGELGVVNVEDLIADLDRQSNVQIKPSQLADLIHHMKEVIFERVPPVKLEYGIKNHNRVMRLLKSQAPELFKELSTGEVVMVDYELRDDV